MKPLVTIFFLMLLLLHYSSNAAVAFSSLPVSISSAPAMFPSSGIGISGVKKIKEKRKVFRQMRQTALLADNEITPRQKRQARWSLILGVGSFVLAFIPYVGLLSIPAAITAIILGIKSLKGNANTKGMIGLIAGSAFIVAILFVIAFFTFITRFE